MSKNFFIMVFCVAMISIDVACMNDADPVHDLTVSRVEFTVPNTRGLGVVSTLRDWVKSEEENLYNDLVDGSFDPNNSSYHRKLGRSIELFVAKNNDQRLTDVLGLCRTQYNIQLTDVSAVAAHIYLTKCNSSKQENFTHILEAHNKVLVVETNALISEMKKSIGQYLATINALWSEHATKHTALITAECDEIRRVKQGLCTIHKLNRAFKMPNNGYCSDSEPCTQEVAAHFYSPETVDSHYTNQSILTKIHMAEKEIEMREKVEALRTLLASIYKDIQNVSFLQ